MQRVSYLHLFLYTVFTDKDFLVLLFFKNKNKIYRYIYSEGLSIKSLIMNYAL